MPIEVRKLSYALGAEITGVDISKPLDTEALSKIKQAFFDNCVLVFRGQELTRAQHVAFSRNLADLDGNEALGPTSKLADYPEISLVVSKPTATGEAPTGRYAGQDWHSDRTHFPATASASFLRAIEIPAVGGDTMFCNMYHAYEILSDGMKKILGDLHGVYVKDGNSGPDYSTPERAAEFRKRFPAAAHPAVRVHPDTKRNALYVNEEIRFFAGMTRAESLPIINFLTQQATRPQNVYRHQWKKDDLVIWDNRCVLHIALADYDRTKVRHMERTTGRAAVTGYVYDGPLE